MKTELMEDKNFEEIKQVLPFLWIHFMLKFNLIPNILDMA